MKVAFITPSKLLAKLPEVSGYHLILGQEVFKDPNYAWEYAQRIQKGEYVILDNGAYEKGESISVSTFAEMAIQLRPQGIILPDVRFNSIETLFRVEDSLRYFRKVFPKEYHPDLYAVPQGKNLAEVLSMLNGYASMGEINGIGIYSEIGEVTELGNRNNFLQYLEVHGYVEERFKYHLLGMEEDFTALKHLSRYPWVTGIDSAKPIVCGLQGNDIHPDGTTSKIYEHRPKHYFDISKVDADTLTRIRNNIFYVNYLISQK